MKTATLASAVLPAITSTVGVLSDRALLRQTSTLVRHERHLQGAIIDHLAETRPADSFCGAAAPACSTLRCASSATATLPPAGALAPCGCAPTSRMRVSGCATAR